MLRIPFSQLYLCNSRLDLVEFLSLPTKKGPLNLASSALNSSLLSTSTPNSGSRVWLKERGLGRASIQTYHPLVLANTAHQQQGLLQPLPVTSLPEKPWCPPKIICTHLLLKFARNPVMLFSLKFQICNIYGIPFIQILSNSMNGEEWTRRSSHPPLPCQGFYASLLILCGTGVLARLTSLPRLLPFLLGRPQVHFLWVSWNIPKKGS